MSWSSYLLAYGALSLVYYAIVGIFFYRKSLPALLRPSTHHMNRASLSPRHAEGEGFLDAQQEGQEEILQKAEELSEAASDEVKAFFEAIREDERCDKSFVSRQLKKILLKYTGLRGTAYQFGINYLIAQEAQVLNIPFQAEELQQLWDSDM